MIFCSVFVHYVNVYFYWFQYSVNWQKNEFQTNRNSKTKEDSIRMINNSASSCLTSKRKFYCNVCDTKLLDKITFNRHITKKHIIKEQNLSENNKNRTMFTCRVCNTSFVNLYLCKKHMKNEHLDFNCNLRLNINKEVCSEVKKIGHKIDFVEGNSKFHCVELKELCSDTLDSKTSLGEVFNSKILDANNSEAHTSCKNSCTCSDDTVKDSSVLSREDRSNKVADLSKNNSSDNVLESSDNLCINLKNLKDNSSDDFHCTTSDVDLQKSVQKNMFSCQKCGKWVEKYCKPCKSNDAMNAVEALAGVDVSESAVDNNISESCKSISVSKTNLNLANESYNNLLLLINTTNSSEDVNKNISSCNYLNRANDTGVGDRINRNLLDGNTDILSDSGSNADTCKENVVLISHIEASEIVDSTKSSLQSAVNQNGSQFIDILDNNLLLVKENPILVTDSNNELIELSKSDETSYDKNCLCDGAVKIDSMTNQSVDNITGLNENSLQSVDKLDSCSDNLNDRSSVSLEIKTFVNETGSIGSRKQTKSVITCEPVMKNNQLHCLLCDDSFPNDLSFKEHYLCHDKGSSTGNGKKLMSCFVCNETFEEISSVYSHINEQHSYWIGYYCFLCRLDFNNINIDFVNHCKSEHSVGNICTFCGENLKTRTKFLGHLGSAHRYNLNCNFCSKSFTNLKKLKIHEKNHEKPEYVCDICNKSLKTRSGMKVHKLLHSKEYLYVCEFCGKGFVSAHSLNEHKNTHFKESRYVCDVCGKEFHLYDTYNKHRKHHIDPYPKQCDICKQYFRSASRLAEHKRRKHTFERPYKCPYCPLSFHISNILKSHLFVHTKQYPFTCTICSKGFPARNKYALHMLKKHKDDSYIKNRFPNNKERKEEWLNFSRHKV